MVFCGEVVPRGNPDIPLTSSDFTAGREGGGASVPQYGWVVLEA